MIDPKRILHVVGTMNKGGAETFLMNHYRVCDKQLIQFDFLYFTNETTHFDDEITSNGGIIYRIDKKSILSRLIFFFLFLKKNKTFHAVHLHLLVFNGFLSMVTFLTGYKRIIVHSHSTKDRVSIIGVMYLKLARILINFYSSRIVACGKEAGIFLYGKKSDFIIIPNAIDVKIYKPQFESNKTAILTESPLDKGIIKIVQIGRLIPLKNQLFSLFLMKILKDKGIKFHLFIIGIGPCKEILEQKILEYKLSSFVTLAGNRDDVNELISEMDVMLLPSIFEGFPLVMVEAQAAGIPSLVSNQVSEEVDLGLNLVDFLSLNEPEKWVDCILNSKVKKKNNTAHHKILQDLGFDVEISNKNLLQLYQLPS